MFRNPPEKPHNRESNSNSETLSFPSIPKALVDVPPPTPMYQMKQPEPKSVYYQRPVPTIDDLHHEELIDTKRLNEAVIESPFTRFQTATEREQAIAREFNQHLNGESYVTNAINTGKAIEPGKFWLVHQDGKPQLVPPTTNRYWLKPNPLGTSEERLFDQNSLVIGWKGHYVINVPMNKIAKVKEGNELKFYGPGFHVIHAPSLKLEQTDLIEPDAKYSSHGNKHLLRIPPDEIAIIEINKIPYILKPREGHYAIESPYISKEPTFVKRYEQYTDYGIYTILNIPEGKLARIKINNIYYLLQAREGGYVFNDPSCVITYNTVNNKREYFVDANSTLIKHGPITSVMPRTGQVAIAYDNGNLIIIHPNKKPYLKNDYQFTCEEFLSTQIQNENYPSSETKTKLRKNGVTDEDQIQFICARTTDNLPVGVQLQVSFSIDKPEIALKQFPNIAALKAHIEDTITSEMTTEIAERSMRDFQNASNTQKDSGNQAGPAILTRLADTATKILAKEFNEKLGVTLTRLRIERQKILDKSIESEMSKNALISAKTSADMANLVMDTNIKTQQAEREAKINAIKQQQEIQNTVNVAKADKEAKIAKAEADLEAAKRQAEITRELARADADKAITMAKSTAEKAKIDMGVEVSNLENANLIKTKQAERDAQIAKIKQEQDSSNLLVAANAEKSAKIAKAEGDFEAAKRQADITRELARADADKTVTIANSAAEKAKIDVAVDVANLENANLIKVKQAERDAEIAKIKQEQESKNAVIAANAEKEAKVAKSQGDVGAAQSQAEIIRELAKAKHDEIILLAQAKAKQSEIETEATISNKLKLLQMETAYIIELAKAQAEAQRLANEQKLKFIREKGEILTQLPVVQQQEALQMQTDAVAKNAKWYVTPQVASSLSTIVTNSIFAQPATDPANQEIVAVQHAKLSPQ